MIIFRHASRRCEAQSCCIGLEARHMGSTFALPATIYEAHRRFRARDCREWRGAGGDDIVA